MVRLAAALFLFLRRCRRKVVQKMVSVMMTARLVNVDSCREGAWRWCWSVDYTKDGSMI